MTRARAPQAAAALGLCLATLAGCGGPPSDPVRWPADPASDTPAIDWPNGAPDTSDEWVATLLDYQIAMAVARNTHDFSRPALAEVATQEHIASWAGSAEMLASHIEGNASHYPYSPGPNPMTIRDVKTEDDHATITTCEPSNWEAASGPPPGPDDLSEEFGGKAFTYALRREPDGHTVVTDREMTTPGSCRPDNPRAGYFDPPPPYGRLVPAEEVIGPDGRPIQESW